MKFLITGAGGLLGRALMRHLGALHQIVGLDRNPKAFPCQGKWIKVDFINIKSLKDLLQKINPDVVIHTAEKFDVDDCEKKPKEAEEQQDLNKKKSLKQCQEKQRWFTSRPTRFLRVRNLLQKKKILQGRLMFMDVPSLLRSKSSKSPGTLT